MARAARGRRAIEVVRLALGGMALTLVCGFALPRLAALPPDAYVPDPGFVPTLAAAHPDERAGERRRVVPDRVGSLAVTDETAFVMPPGTDTIVSRTVPRRAFAAAGGEFEWQAIHGTVDGRRWRAGAPAKSPVQGRRLHGIGFPAITRRGGPRVYRPLIAWRDAVESPGGRLPIPHLRCMGLSPTAVARRASRYEVRILELAMQHQVSAALVKAVITEESCFDPKAESHAGAVGLMQLMPATARWLKSGDPRNPDANLRGGIRYLAMLLERYDGDTELTLAGYNAGPGNVRRYGGVPPFAETRRYVKRVQANYRRYVAATALAAR